MTTMPAAARRAWERGNVQQPCQSREVIVIVANIRPAELFADTQPTVYRLARESDCAQPGHEGVTLLVRAKPGVEAAVEVRELLRSTDPDVTLVRATTMTREVRRSMLFVRATVSSYAFLGAFGMLFALTGLAAVTAYTVARRTREIGIRMALGASAGRVLRMVMREGGWMTVVGGITGMAAAWGAAKLCAAYVEGLAEVMQLSLGDPMLLAGAPALLIACPPRNPDTADRRAAR